MRVVAKEPIDLSRRESDDGRPGTSMARTRIRSSPLPAPVPSLRPGNSPATEQEVELSVGRRIGQSLKRLRKDRGLSLDQLAALSGVSRAALSHIEGAHANPTLSLLWKVAVGLGVPFQLLLGAGKNSVAQVLRDGESPPLRSADGRMESRLLSPAGAGQGQDIYQLRFLPKGFHKSEPHAEGTTEILIVLSGAMRISVGDEAHDLAVGDSIFFHADVPHCYESRSSREARCIDVISYGRSY
jgi:transcriptional regulator with XRE-family HTH domain